MQGSNVIHHYHKRKRINLKKEVYPHPNKWVNLMDKLIYLVAIGGPILTIPQVLKIWIEQSASGVSVLTWGAYLIGAFFWLIYGFMHKEKPIIISNFLWIIMEIFIVVGIVKYG